MQASRLYIHTGYIRIQVFAAQQENSESNVGLETSNRSQDPWNPVRFHDCQIPPKSARLVWLAGLEVSGIKTQQATQLGYSGYSGSTVCPIRTCIFDLRAST